MKNENGKKEGKGNTWNTKDENQFISIEKKFLNDLVL